MCGIDAQPSRHRGKGEARAWGRRLARLPIRLYQVAISPMIGPRCRHMPTCSDYADQAIGRYGGWAGGWMALARIARCHPLGSHGFDPVPEALPLHAAWYMPWRYGRWTGRHITLKVD